MEVAKIFLSVERLRPSSKSDCPVQAGGALTQPQPARSSASKCLGFLEKMADSLPRCQAFGQPLLGTPGHVGRLLALEKFCEVLGASGPHRNVVGPRPGCASGRLAEPFAYPRLARRSASKCLGFLAKLADSLPKCQAFGQQMPRTPGHSGRVLDQVASKWNMGKFC